MAMRLIASGSLSDLLKRERLARARAVAILRGVAEALDYAHAKGIVHRDVKPQNVLLDDAARVYLADFGIAKILESSGGLTASGMITGTPQYMAPEQATGLKIGPPADVYALGIMAYEMLVGRVPFSADTPVAVLMKHVQEPLPLPAPDVMPEPMLRALLKARPRSPRSAGRRPAPSSTRSRPGSGCRPRWRTWWRATSRPSRSRVRFHGPQHPRPWFQPRRRGLPRGLRLRCRRDRRSCVRRRRAPRPFPSRRASRARPRCSSVSGRLGSSASPCSPGRGCWWDARSPPRHPRRRAPRTPARASPSRQPQRARRPRDSSTVARGERLPAEQGRSRARGGGSSGRVRGRRRAVAAVADSRAAAART
jgi:serine/threonine protein kinase